MDPITLEDVKKFFEENKDAQEVLEYITSISIEKPLNPEVVKGYLETAEGKAVLQPMLDSFATRSIQSHDEKNKPKTEAEIARRVNEKLMEFNKEDTPEQKIIKEMAIRQKEFEAKYELEKKLAKINEIAYKEGIDPVFVEGLSFDSAEQFGLYANKFKEYNKKSIEKAINDFVASTSFKPSKGQEKEGKINLNNLSEKEILEMEMNGTLDAALKGE